MANARLPSMAGVVLLGLVITFGVPGVAMAGKLSWLDDIVHEVIIEAKAGGKSLGHDVLTGSHRTEVQRAGRLFIARDSEEGLERLIRQSNELERVGRRIDRPTEALLEGRFSRLLRPDPQALRTFAALEPAEKRLVVELGETAQHLARRYPGQAESLIQRLGPDGLTAIRVFGDQVAEVLIKEGPESLGVLRKTGRAGWSFFTQQVLPHKKKLAAAGVLAAFLANPEKFVDYAGQATEFAVREFAKSGIQLASSVGGGALRGLENTIGESLASYGFTLPMFRYIGMGMAGLSAVLALLVVVGLPIRWIFRPFGWVFWSLTQLFKRIVRRGPLVESGNL